MSSGSWAGYSSRFKRFITIFLCIIFCIVMTVGGTLTPLSHTESNNINKQIDQLRTTDENTSLWQGALSIFENNFAIDLVMFIPIAGWVFGSIVLYNSGLAFNALSTDPTISNPNHFSGTIIFLLNFISPHQTLEFIAYGTAFAASIWLFWRIVRGGAIRELKRTGMFILICAVLLLVAAFIEEYLLLTLG
ncbi:MAG TPA: stage II sporulation protein M [Candidatus Acidoferrum sp.]|nr:stage II sporulation protein M [Candidatus Acidoferrum sp.]